MRQPPLNVVTGSAIIFFEKPTFNIISATSSLVEPQAWMRLCGYGSRRRRETVAKPPRDVLMAASMASARRHVTATPSPRPRQLEADNWSWRRRAGRLDARERPASASTPSTRRAPAKRTQETLRVVEDVVDARVVRQLAQNVGFHKHGLDLVGGREALELPVRDRPHERRLAAVVAAEQAVLVAPF